MSTSKTVAERFRERVDKHGPAHPSLGECWVWLGSKDRGGYGYFSIDDETKRAHRVAWFLFHGVWPTMGVLHKCDNPSCVRDSHLFEGTDAENSSDMVAKGRSAKGEKHPGVKLTEAQVLDIRTLYVPGILTRGRGAWTQRKLARKYGVDQRLIWAIIHRVLWRHI